VRFRLVVDESKRLVLTGGRCSVVIVKAGLTLISKTAYKKTLVIQRMIFGKRLQRLATKKRL
jgi:hypothetical protein